MIYLLHLASPLGNLQNPRAMAQHYIGVADDVARRLAEHRAGRGAALTRAAVERGISFEVVATWPGDRGLERQLKRLKAAPRLCPVCGVAHPRGRLHVPSIEDLFDVPAPPARADWYEIATRRRWQQCRPAPVAPTATGDGPSYHIAF